MDDNLSPDAGRFADLLLDHWFKRAFGTEPRKRLLTLLLQELIPEHRISDLRYAPQEHVNPFPGKRDVRIDVECTDADGSRFLVEMQRVPQFHFYERAVFNSSFAIQQQLRSGDGSYDLPAVYFIGIMDFSLHRGSDRVLFRYSLREDSSGEPMTDRLQYLFLELPNCSRALTPEASVLDNFCYALHNMRNLPERPEGFGQEIFRLLFDSAEIATFTPEEKTKYEYEMTTERDIKNQIFYAETMGQRKGREEGLVQGREEGIRDNQRETARRMLADGLPVEQVLRYTDLTTEEIQAL